MAIDFPDSPSINDEFSAGGKVWRFNGTTWALLTGSSTPAAGSIDSSILATGSVTEPKINAGTATNGYFLKVDTGEASGLVWSSIPTINALDDIGDVSASAPSNGDFLQWNGSAWIPAAASTDVMRDTKNAALITMAIGD